MGKLSSAKMTNEELITQIIAVGILKTREITEAFYAVDRADFVPSDNLSEAYEDYPLSIGYSQTISQPSTVAFMLELLGPKSGDKILDVGSGSGWTTALLARIVGPSGRVLGVEIVPELAKLGQENLARYSFAHAKIHQAGISLGFPEEAPFDKILVSAAAEQFPSALFDQLKTGGRMVVPVQNSVFTADKTAEGEILKEEFTGFVFVPLK